MTTDKHISLLFRYILFAPREIQRKYCNGAEFHSIEWFLNKTDECSFRGILFRENRVFVINIEILCKDNNFVPQYLDITDVFNKLLKRYNIYHLCVLISTVLRKKFYKESSLAQKLRFNIKYDTPYKLPKFKYSIERHHSRERKFYYSTESEGKRAWTGIINQTLCEVINLASFEGTMDQGQPTLFTDFGSVPEFNPNKNSHQRSEDLRDGKPRKLRRGFYAFSNKRGR